MTPSAPITRLPFCTDSGAGGRARLGLLVLESDQTLEHEFTQLTDVPGVATYHARLANETQVSPDTLALMEAELPKAAALLPAYLGLDAIGYGCTSGTTMIGEARVTQICQAAHPGVPVSNPLSAAKAAFRALGITRLGLVTPYAPEVTRAMQAAFDAAGTGISAVGSFYEADDRVVGRIEAASIHDAVCAIGAQDCDGVFVACTSLRAAGIIAQAEQTLGKPVTASNHALAWHMMQLAGVGQPRAGYGRLYQTGLC